jgi:hypothetical protein
LNAVEKCPDLTIVIGPLLDTGTQRVARTAAPSQNLIDAGLHQ